MQHLKCLQLLHWACVIHYGPPRSIVNQLQEAGRAGRGGKQAHNIIYYEGRHLIHCDKSLKTTLKSASCLRVGLYSAFDEAITPLLPLHLCYQIVTCPVTVVMAQCFSLNDAIKSMK